MRRALLTSLLVALVGGLLPAGAAPGGAVVTQGSTFFPGDDCVSSFQGTCVGGSGPLLVLEGGDLHYANFDVLPHNIWSNRCKGASGDFYNLSCPVGKSRLFSSDDITTGGSGLVRGVESLAAGEYRFFCSIHPAMRGRLTVV